LKKKCFVRNNKGHVVVVDESCWMARESSKPIEEPVEGASMYQLGGSE
jgi:hypothetical protein